jgi:hypothetical protein
LAPVKDITKNSAIEGKKNKKNCNFKRLSSENSYIFFGFREICQELQKGKHKKIQQRDMRLNVFL